MVTDSRVQGIGVAEPGMSSANVSTGFDLDDLPVGAVLEVETGHTTYILENLGNGKVLISGHPTYCPEPVEVEFQGAVGGPALLELWRIEPGLRMAFQHPKVGTIRTSRVRSVRKIGPKPTRSVA
ncbi:MAG TPA: hypothetical protein VKX49_15645 [Bryobacteraceae bacterium]|nr:hypothetical protein [Bryobacteraceae bacterium]